MARTDINKVLQDLQEDDGSVLFSLILGEQREFPITLNFLANAYGYTYEAVLVEALNVAGSEEIPKSVQPGGVKTTLVVRVPTDRGNWFSGNAYDREDYVKYGSVYYKMKNGTGYTSAIPPNTDPAWEEYTPNKIYIQFPSTLGAGYAVQPTVDIPVYAFFELSVTEPVGGLYRQTFKPVRGVVEFSFSPTELV